MTNISTSNVYRDRMDFAKIHTSIPIPNLIEVQRKSYHRFLQMDVPPAEREDVGLQAVFNSVFPINDFRGTSSLEFVEYSIGNWQCKCGNLKGLDFLKVDCQECHAPIQHGKVELVEPLEVRCESCHIRQHNLRKLMYIGTGGKLVPDLPSRMFAAQVSCTGCHVHVTEKGDILSHEARTPGCAAR